MNITISICTRNRENNLKKCTKSIAKQEINFKSKIEVLIMDDGELSNEYMLDIKNILNRFEVHYHKKKNPGLYLSRLKSIELAKGDIILFLDDDVVLESDYINNALEVYEKHPCIAGVGGVDIILPRYSIFRTIYTSLFLYRSYNIGKLSITGLNSSMNQWINQKTIFKTEYFNGCNMSFKKGAIKNLPAVEFFNNYSLGEDLFISLYANKNGKLLVNPNMKVKHFQTSISRDKLENISKMKVINHYKMLPYLKSGKMKYILIYWTYLGMLLASLLKRDFKEVSGYLQGLKSI